jgi:hypothetical protein
MKFQKVLKDIAGEKRRIAAENEGHSTLARKFFARLYKRVPGAFLFGLSDEGQVRKIAVRPSDGFYHKFFGMSYDNYNFRRIDRPNRPDHVRYYRFARDIEQNFRVFRFHSGPETGRQNNRANVHKNHSRQIIIFLV